MPRLFTDTDPDMEALFLSLMREAPAWWKLAMVDQLNQTVRSLALNGLRKRHPQGSGEELKWLLAELTLGSDMASRVRIWSGEQESRRDP